MLGERPDRRARWLQAVDEGRAKSAAMEGHCVINRSRSRSDADALGGLLWGSCTAATGLLTDVRLGPSLKRTNSEPSGLRHLLRRQRRAQTPECRGRISKRYPPIHLEIVCIAT